MNNNITSLPKLYSGKVRDLYAVNDKYMLMVASDRLSAFDIILNQDIPKKGIYLTQISLFWMQKLKHIINNHTSNKKLEDYLSKDELEYTKGRGIIVKRLKPVPIEVIIRGYLAGSGYKDYLATGKISGITLPPGLRKADKLPKPIFTPSTKAAKGDHDENITLDECRTLIGNELTAQVEKIALELYVAASKIAENHEIILADTKFEFGLDENNTLTLMDEALTPDSSRFWEMQSYIAGTEPHSFDKQFIRNYLEKDIKWNKLPPIPDLPEDIIQKTSDRYYEIINRFGIELK